MCLSVYIVNRIKTLMDKLLLEQTHGVRVTFRFNEMITDVVTIISFEKNVHNYLL